MENAAAETNSFSGRGSSHALPSFIDHLKGEASVKRFFSVLLFFLLAAFFTTAEGAAWYNASTGGMWNNPGSCLLDTMIYNKAIANVTLKNMQRNKAPTAKPQKQAPVVKPTTYRPSGTSLKVPSALSSSLTNDRDERKALEEFFKQSIANFNEFSKQAERSNDLGYALAFFFGVCVGLTTENEVDDAAMLAAAKQMDVILAEQPGLKTAGDGKKQEMAETLACMATLALAGYTQAEQTDDREAADKFLGLARDSMLEAFGIDVDKVRMDREGIRLLE